MWALNIIEAELSRAVLLMNSNISHNVVILRLNIGNLHLVTLVPQMTTSHFELETVMCLIQQNRNKCVYDTSVGLKGREGATVEINLIFFPLFFPAQCLHPTCSCNPHPARRHLSSVIAATSGPPFMHFLLLFSVFSTFCTALVVDRNNQAQVVCFQTDRLTP